ncbi:MAG: RDD family protein [Pseudomonadota bacterium]
MSTNPYATPKAPLAELKKIHLEYAGFWIRTGATLIDAVLIIAIADPLLITIYGWAYYTEPQFIAGPADFLISWVAPAVASILFWMKKQATPGKMAVSAKIVDARTGKSLTLGQSIGRYLGYYVSILPLGLGFFWVAFDPRKQGWHDKMAGTVVVRPTAYDTDAVTFDQA